MIYAEFTEKLDRILQGDKEIISRPLVVGKPSQILIECGANAEQDITITKKVIDKALRPEVRDKNGKMVGHTGHGLAKELIVKAVLDLESPVMIFNGRRNGSLLVITSAIDSNNRNIVVAIEFDKQESFMKVNSIRSIYGRDNIALFIGNNIKNGNLMAANKEKADELLRSIGKSYPKENTFISFI